MKLTKKNVVRKKYAYVTWLIEAILIVIGIYDVKKTGEWIVICFFAVPIILVFIWVKIDEELLKHKITRQERCLGVSFDENMKGVQIGGVLSWEMEAAAYEDWYVLMSVGGVIAVNRRYVTGLRDVSYQIQRRNVSIRIIFDTKENKSIQFKIGDYPQAVSDLCQWLGYRSPLTPKSLKETDLYTTEIQTAKRTLQSAWKDYEKSRTEWDKKRLEPEHKKRIKAIQRMRDDLWSVEYAICDYYSHDVVRKYMDTVKDDIRRLYDSYDRVEGLFKAEKIIDDYVFIHSKLFPDLRLFQKDYTESKKKLTQASEEQKQKRLKDICDTVSCFADDIGERYIANRNIGNNNREDFDEAVAAVLQAADEVEEFQKEIHHPKIDGEIAELYYAMHVNGLLPKERESRFPERMNKGEIHRIYR